MISFATQGLKQSLALHSVHATHLHSLGNQSATFRQIGNFGTIPSGQKTFGESILSHSQLSLSLVLGFSGNIENIAHAAMTRQVNIAHAVMTRSCCIPFTLHKTAVWHVQSDMQCIHTAAHLRSPSAWTSVQRRPEKQCAQWVHSRRARGRVGKGCAGQSGGDGGGGGH